MRINNVDPDQLASPETETILFPVFKRGHTILSEKAAHSVLNP